MTSSGIRAFPWNRSLKCKGIEAIGGYKEMGKNIFVCEIASTKISPEDLPGSLINV